MSSKVTTGTDQKKDSVKEGGAPSQIPRVFNDARGRAGRGWMVPNVAVHQSNIWNIPIPARHPQFIHEELMAAKSIKPPHQRFVPYEKRSHMQFTRQDIERCLYAKQDIRVVQVGDDKPSPMERSISRSSNSSGNEDKNKPAKWCDMCQEIRFGECPQHGPLPSLRPSVTLPGPKSYAISTFPDEVGLCISSLPLAGYGVFARHFIPVGTWIGPYEGKKISAEEGLKQISQGDAPFLWEIFENNRLSHFLDASDENTSSWMRFIQCARHRGEQNLFVFQYYGSIYYRAFKDILVGQELLLWYDEKYPQYFGLPEEIRDMSACSMESIQAPVEVSKPSIENDHQIREMKDGRSSFSSFAPQGKVNSQSLRERTDPPRIPLNNQINSHHLSSPYLPPTLSQAPSIHDGRSSSGYLESRLPYPRKPNASRTNVHSHLPRSPKPGHMFPKDARRSPSSMHRSSSAEDLSKRSERNIKREMERGGFPNEMLANQHYPPSALFAAQINNSVHGGGGVVAYSRFPPSIMTVASHEHSKKFEDASRQSNLKVMNENERASSALKERMFQETFERNRVRASASLSQDRNLHEVQDSWDVIRCQTCRQTFTQKIAFERHQCNKDSSKPYQCGKCQLSFHEAHDLQEHMALHTAERPYKCGVCSRSFAATSALSNHMRMHANNSANPTDNSLKEKSLIDCPKCGKKFQHPSEISKHISPNGECIT